MRAGCCIQGTVQPLHLSQFFASATDKMRSGMQILLQCKLNQCGRATKHKQNEHGNSLTALCNMASALNRQKDTKQYIYEEYHPL